MDNKKIDANKKKWFNYRPITAKGYVWGLIASFLLILLFRGVLWIILFNICLIGYIYNLRKQYLQTKKISKKQIFWLILSLLFASIFWIGFISTLVVVTLNNKG